MFLTKGVGVHRQHSGVRVALRDADIEQQNLVYVIHSATALQSYRCEEAVNAQAGDITFCVLARRR
jgi:pyruvoyl-dependent arginine decarboxylase (PvlArgDC)